MIRSWPSPIIAISLISDRNAGFSVGEVAKAVGITSQSYFTTRFKERFGTTPTDYQNRCL